jgi:hypothetical protein
LAPKASLQGLQLLDVVDIQKDRLGLEGHDLIDEDLMPFIPYFRPAPEEKEAVFLQDTLVGAVDRRQEDHFGRTRQILQLGKHHLGPGLGPDSFGTLEHPHHHDPLTVFPAAEGT